MAGDAAPMLFGVRYTGVEALAALQPDLVRFARGELFRRYLDVQLAEDLVADATVRFLTTRIQSNEPRRVRAWFRTTIRRLAVDRVRRPGRDVLNQVGVLSLDDKWARGD
ncbi:MAG TPA: sigma factor [Candidatus Dormibacteraeota bacterium]|nr:sigma factor [Candidatus Dormibacteraeota bacterium]